MKQNPNLISVVIPVFNKEKYLSTCLDSILAQQHAPLDIICVDDGSTDDSCDVLHEYARHDHRIRVIRSPRNEGPGSARNRGISMAKGDFIAFVDADDSIPSTALLNLHKAILLTGNDVAIGGLLWQRTQTSKGAPSQLVTQDSPTSLDVTSSAYLQSLPGNHCCNLYSLSFLKRENILYPTDLLLGEDQVLQAESFIKARNVTKIKSVVYHYHHYRSSSLTLGELSLKHFLDDIEYQSRIAQLFFNANLPDAATRHLQRWPYSIKEYWCKMPTSLTTEEAHKVFSKFNDVISMYGIRPWTNRMPEIYQTLLRSILEMEYNKALCILRNINSQQS